MGFSLQSLLDGLAEQDLITPYLESSILADNWPDFYTVHIDSRPYYGLKEDGSPDGYFHPSTHALMGERELYYRFHPDTRDKMIFERRTLQQQMTLVMGSALHGVLQTQMQMTGLVKEENIEREYIIHDHHVRGRIDWIVDHPNGQQVVTELKTRNSHLWSNQAGPEPSWIAQLNLGLDAMDQDLGVLLMMESGWPYRLREFRVRRDRELLDNIYSKFDRVRQAIARNEPPRHCCGIGDKKVIANCPARYQCWLKDEVR